MRGVWPASLNDTDPAVLQRWTVVALRTMSHRALSGIFVYLLLCLAYGAAVLGDPRSLELTGVTFVVLLGLGALRLLLHIRGLPLMARRPGLWRRLFSGSAVTSILVWDGFAAIELVHRDLDAMSFILVIASAGLRASAMYSLAPDLRTLRMYSTISRLPMILTLVVIGGPVANLLVFLTATQTLYALLLGRRLYHEFWQAFAINDALRDKTQGLETANAALQAEIRARERVEVELRLAQKLEAVGRLAAGIAHELNTPLQFVGDNLRFARDGVSDLLALLERYRTECAALERGDITPGAGARLAAAEQAADLPFLVDNLPESLDTASDGLARVATTVRSIIVFAHPDRAEMAQVDLNREVQTTLAIARHEYSAVAEVQTDLAELPPVTCHAGEINQVVLNLLVNAAHAIEGAARSGDKGVITVRTRRAGDCVEIAVSDTGGGIAENIRDRVFDPFFTTKEVGKGAGQGLAVARAVIVKRHGGEISFETEVGRGTTFLVKIPIRRPPGDREGDLASRQAA